MKYTINGNLNLPEDNDIADQVPLNANATRLSHCIPYASIDQLKADTSLQDNEVVLLILDDRSGGFYKVSSTTATGAILLTNGKYAVPVSTWLSSLGDTATGNIKVPNAVVDPDAPNWGQVKKLVAESQYNHPAGSPQSSSNTGTTVIQSVNFDSMGHNTGTTAKTLSTSDFVTPGTGISINGKVVAHTDTSSQASVNNTGNTVIQGITLDGMGHITGILSKTINAGFTFNKGVNGSLIEPATGFKMLWQECTFTSLSKSFTWHSPFANAVYIAIPVDVCTASDHDHNGVDPYLVSYDTTGFVLRNRNGQTGRLCTCKILAIGW